MSKISPSELDARRSVDDVFVIDIRPRENYQREHVEGSVNVPVYGDLRRGDTASLDEHLDRIPNDREVVTVCKAGIVAQKATAHLEARGYDATTLTGGYTGWRHYDENTVPYRLLSFLRKLVP
ncbi:rhodanese-like domain-containing protein (plasmid) [Halorussus salilacus]|uniref:rhodanese-like domain-containing protein n=1 Tax=Halorussus salilacus TaxID=2953750 RepID=UPI0020A029C3|nr:rhodanese-like domain-containing protein [Halorussus salilacus]USZ70146.1 rhodanese-like domain-containing protein [Halorussus salilacus]